MNASKNTIAMISTGTATLIGLGVFGFLTLSALSQKGEDVEDLESALESVRKIQRAEIAPTKEAIAAVDSNRTTIAIWADEAYALASDGDITIDSDLNEASFKQLLVDEARELSKLPGGVNGAIVAEDFTFGFKDYISGGVMPRKEQLPLLQRQWADIRLMVKTLADCSVIEITKIAAIADTQPTIKEEPKAKKRSQKKAKAEPESTISAATYELEFRARPAALARVFNAFAETTRFITVNQFSFVREADMIASSLGGDKDKPAAAPRRRRRGNVAAEENTEESTSKKKGLVTDPEEEAPFLVKMNLCTYDFGSKALTDDREEVAE